MSSVWEAGVIVLIVALVGLLYWSYWHQQDCADAMFDMSTESEAEHAKCMALVAAFVGDEFAARVLQAAAEEYDTAQGQADIRALSKTVWVEGGPSIPSLWMRGRAEKILAKTHHENCDRTLSGECVVHRD